MAVEEALDWAYAALKEILSHVNKMDKVKTSAPYLW